MVSESYTRTADDGRSPPGAARATLGGLSDGTTRGGHLLEGQVWPTLEVIIRDSSGQLRKTDRPDIGLALIALDQGS